MDQAGKPGPPLFQKCNSTCKFQHRQSLALALSRRVGTSWATTRTGAATMKRALVGLIAATALVSPAVAADLPLPVEPIVAPIPVFSWTGFYAGANVGWGCCSDQDVGVFDHDDVDGDGDIFEGDIASLDDDGVFAGVQAGYNFQWNWLVTGVEADWQWSGIFDDESGTTATGPADGFRGHASSDVDWFATLRGRAGFAWQRFFLYGTGGLAAGNVEYTVRLRG